MVPGNPLIVVMACVFLHSCSGITTGPIEVSPPISESAQTPETSETEGALQTLIILPSMSLNVPAPEDIKAVQDEKETQSLDAGVSPLHLGGERDARIYLKFDIGIIPEGTELHQAKLELTKGPKEANGPVEIVIGSATDQWTPDINDWKAQPLMREESVFTVMTDGEALDAFDVLEILNAWVAGEQPIHGFILKVIPDEYEPSKSYHSSDGARLDLWPRLVVTYKANKNDNTSMSRVGP